MNQKISLRIHSIALITFLLSFMNGCGSANPAGRIPVSGEVTLDGTSLDGGTIEFTPIAGKIGSGGKIAAGKYNLPLEKGLPPGDYIVRITSPTIPPAGPSIAKAPGMEPEDIHLGKERVHARFNSKSELKMTVPADAQSFIKNFTVTSR
jgi:hypothetical protein